MAIKFARFNIELSETSNSEKIADEWQSMLNDAAIEGYANSYEIFYSSQLGVVGVSIPYESEDPISLLEAGAVLGFCQSRCEQSDIGEGQSMWLSLHEADDSTIYSPI